MVNKSVAVDPETFTIVKYIFETYHDKKYSINKISTFLNDQNIKAPKHGKKWYPASVGIILDNKDKYEGQLMEGNENGICWPKILHTFYPDKVLPYGYIMIDDTISIDSDAARIVKYIYKLYQDPNCLANNIVSVLNDQHIKPPKYKQKWCESTINIILNDKVKYDGGLINKNDVLSWPRILDIDYPNEPVKSIDS